MQSLAQPAGAVLDVTGQEDSFSTRTGACASGGYRYDPWCDLARLLKLGCPDADGLVELSLSSGRARLPGPGPGAAHGVSRPDDARPAGTGVVTGRDRS